MSEGGGNRPVRILVVDKDSRFASSVVKEHKALKESQPDGSWPRPVFADTVRESQSYLSNRDYAYAGVFVNPAIGTPGWLAIIRASHQYRAGAPVYVVYDEPPKVSEKESKALGVQGFLKKPLNYQRLLELVTNEPEVSGAPEAEAADTSATKRIKNDAPAPTNDGDFVTVELADLSGAAKSLFDLYVKLGPGKYVKILTVGDVLSKDRIESYRKKGVSDLYVTKAAQGEYLEFCDKLVADMLKDQNVSAEVKTANVTNQGQSVASFLKNSQFSEKSLAAAQQFVANTTELVKQISNNSDLVKNILNDVASYEHGVAVSTLASLLLKHLGGQNAAMFNAIGIACFMHDCALLGQPQHVIDEDITKMTDDEKKLFLAHPIDGAKIVKKIKGVPPAVEQAILEHHLRLNKGGFPVEKAQALPHRLAELIGVCEEFVKLIKASETDPSIRPFDVLRARVDKEFSEPIVKAFVKAFEEK